MQRKKHVIITVIAAIAVPRSIVLVLNTAGHPPVIDGLQAELRRVFPTDSVQVICKVSARDGADLSYEWWASGGEIEGEGATATWTAPDFEGVYNIRVTVSDGRNNAVEDYLTIVVEANQPPVIHSLTADADWTAPAGSLNLTCDAEDPDAHPLSYDWSASAGDIDPADHEARWTAPQEVGTYAITVVVHDGYGGSDTRTLHVSVMPDQPPVIDAMAVTAIDPRYLKRIASRYLVGDRQGYVIECIASHPDGSELEYEWECDGGEIEDISEDGSSITWIAPKTYERFAVTVTVSDIGGNAATGSVDLDVRPCSQFG